MITWATYEHLFFLFPCIVYLIFIGFTNYNKLLNSKFRIFMASIAVIVLISHSQSAMWITPGSNFFPKKNAFIEFDSLPFLKKIYIIILFLFSLFAYNILFRYIITI